MPLVTDLVAMFKATMSEGRRLFIAHSRNNSGHAVFANHCFAECDCSTSLAKHKGRVSDSVQHHLSSMLFDRAASQ